PGGAIRVRANVTHVDAQARELIAHEPPHVLVTDARQHCAFAAEACEARREVRGGAAEVLRERLHVLEAAARLLAVEVHGGAAEADAVERAISHGARPPATRKGPPRSSSRRAP